MTRDEAISTLKILGSFDYTVDYLGEHSVSVQDACHMAVKSLEAWEKVKEELSWLDYEYDSDPYSSNHDAMWKIKEVKEIINRYLGEVTE